MDANTSRLTCPIELHGVDSRLKEVGFSPVIVECVHYRPHVVEVV